MANSGVFQGTHGGHRTIGMWGHTHIGILGFVVGIFRSAFLYVLYGAHNDVGTMCTIWCFCGLVRCGLQHSRGVMGFVCRCVDVGLCTGTYRYMGTIRVVGLITHIGANTHRGIGQWGYAHIGVDLVVFGAAGFICL